MDRKHVVMGTVFCIASACLWGITGAAGQYLLMHTGATTAWLVATRTLLAGLLILTFIQIKRGGIFRIWLDKQDRRDIVLFSLGGMLCMQYAYFVSIQYSNAATATVLQYTAPILIVIYLALRQKKLPTPIECIAVVGCLIGTILLATHGNLKNLSLSPTALFWGLLSAVALAFYTVFPVRLLQRYDTLTLIGWSMLIGSTVMHFVHPSWDYAGNWDLPGVLCMVSVVVLGSMVPYQMFLSGVKYIGPTKSSLYASAEPLASTLVSVLWLKVQLAGIDYVGFVFIVAAVLLLSFAKPKEQEKKAEDEGVIS